MLAPSNYIVSGHVHGDADKAEVEVTVYIINEKMETEDFDVDGIVTGEDLNNLNACAKKIKNAIPAFSDCTDCRIKHGNGESDTSKFETTLIRYSKGSFFSGYRELIITFKTLPRFSPGAVQTAPNAQASAGDDRSELIKILRQQEEHQSSIRGMMMFLIILTIILVLVGIWQIVLAYNPPRP